MKNVDLENGYFLFSEADAPLSRHGNFQQIY